MVKKIKPEAEKIGNIVDLNGTIIGQHNGIIHYTIGQRRGLGIGGGKNDDNSPFYVVRVDPKTMKLSLGPKKLSPVTLSKLMIVIGWLTYQITD